MAVSLKCQEVAGCKTGIAAAACEKTGFHVHFKYGRVVKILIQRGKESAEQGSL